MISLYYVCNLCSESYILFFYQRCYYATFKWFPPDISPFLSFLFWEEVYYRHDDSDFPSETREGHGHFVGISEHVGHAMIFKS